MQVHVIIGTCLIKYSPSPPRITSSRSPDHWKACCAGPNEHEEEAKEYNIIAREKGKTVHRRFSLVRIAYRVKSYEPSGPLLPELIPVSVA